MENKTIKINIKKSQFWKALKIEWKNKIKWNFQIDLPDKVKVWDKFNVDWYIFEIEKIISNEWDNFDYDKYNKNKMIVALLFVPILIINAILYTIFIGIPKIGNLTPLLLLHFVTMYFIKQKFPY